MNISAHLNNFFHFKDLLVELVKRDIKVRYRRSVLGMLWSVLNPLLTMVVMTIVFSNMFKNDLPNFPVYIISGYLVFNFFSEGSNQAMSSIIDNRMLIQKVYVPKYILPMARVTAALVNMFFSLIALAIVLLFTGTPLSFSFILIPVGFLYIYCFTLGAGLFLATVAVFFRDIMHLYGVVLTAWMYFTPMFYPLEMLPSVAISMMKFNPLFHYVRYLRCLVWEQQWPNTSMNLYCLLFSVIAMVVGGLVFYKNQNKFAQVL